MLWLYGQIRQHRTTGKSVYLCDASNGRLSLRDDFTLHVYISTLPCKRKNRTA